MPISFIICGLVLIYILFDKELENRLIYFLSVLILMAGFFIPSLKLGECYVNIVLFFLPLVFAIIRLFSLSHFQLWKLLILLSLTTLGYMILVNIDNNLSLAISPVSFVLITFSTMFLSKSAILSFVVLATSCLEIVSIFYNNPNNILIVLGSVSSLNFIVLNIVVFAVLNFVVERLRKAKYEKIV